MDGHLNMFIADWQMNIDFLVVFVPTFICQNGKYEIQRINGKDHAQDKYIYSTIYLRFTRR